MDNKISDRPRSRTDELLTEIESQTGKIADRLQPILSKPDAVEKNPPKQEESTDLNQRLGNINENLADIISKISI